MSAKDVEWAYTIELPGPQKAVLVALAHCRNGVTGKCFPSQQELARMSGFAIATVRRSLDVLVEYGIVTRTKTTKGKWRANDEYELNYRYDPALAESTAQPEYHSDSEEVVITQSQSGAQSERAVVPTGNTTGRQQEGEGARKRGTRIPEPFIVTSDMRQWAASETPAVDVDRSTRMFVDHWRSSTGRNATKLDWPATWRNWLRRDQQSTQPRAPRETPTQRLHATLALAPSIKELQ